MHNSCAFNLVHRTYAFDLMHQMKTKWIFACFGSMDFIVGYVHYLFKVYTVLLQVPIWFFV